MMSYISILAMWFLRSYKGWLANYTYREIQSSPYTNFPILAFASECHIIGHKEDPIPLEFSNKITMD